MRDTHSSERQIVPGASNEVAIDLIATHIRRQMSERELSHRRGLTEMPSFARNASGKEILAPAVTVLHQTPQLKVGRQNVSKAFEADR